MHGKFKIYYDDGGVYVGDIKNNKKNGEGKQMDWNGNIYVGKWKNDLEHGEGYTETKDGEITRGIWKYGKM